MVSGRDLTLTDGRLVRVHDSGPDAAGTMTLVWHHGSPQTGALLEPVLLAAKARGIRLVSYGRPSYGGSSPLVGRDVASAAGDVEQIVDALGVTRFVTIGASGGGPHALACAAFMPDRVIGVATLAGLAPFTTSFDWYAGMVADGALRAAGQGREARAHYAATHDFDENSFAPVDWAALEGAWASLGTDAVRAGNDGPDGQIDDDMAFVAPWGFDVTRIDTPILVVHGGQDRVIPLSHGEWLVGNCRAAELWLRPRAGHISILDATPVALDWLLALSPS
jgi:pimeloyl-ACP methyl ester carboxylesterase